MTATKQTERPLIFTADSVNAIIAQRKSMTRRILKPQPPAWVTEAGWTAFTPPGHISFRGMHPTEGYGEKFVKCGWAKGMRLWVKEAFRLHPGPDPRVEYCAGGDSCEVEGAELSRHDPAEGN